MKVSTTALRFTLNLYDVWTSHKISLLKVGSLVGSYDVSGGNMSPLTLLYVTSSLTWRWRQEMSLKHLQNSTRLPGVTSQNVPLILRATRRVVPMWIEVSGRTTILPAWRVFDSRHCWNLFTTWLAMCLNILISSDRLYGVAVNLNGNSSWLWSIFSCQSALVRRVALELKVTKCRAISLLYVGVVTMTKVATRCANARATLGKSVLVRSP